MSTSASRVMLEGDGIKDTQTAQKYLTVGRSAETAGDRLAAIEAYEAAFAADPDSPETCFRLAYNLDLVGEEDEALHLYEQCAQQPAPAINALINLTIMYEDRGEYEKAERCIRQVLATEPNHARARLYLKDIVASTSMVVDDQVEQKIAVPETPVTDFELTVRTRNALRKMNIRTLSDLLRITEAELRGFKNFGEASIEEIKAMLAQRGLRLGQAIEQAQQAAKQKVYDQLRSEPGTDEQLLNRTVNELNLSVRARKALALLNIHTIGDLCLKTDAELMGVKNFGSTSLNEIKRQLEQLGLSLRKLEQ